MGRTLILIGVLILWSSWEILRETVNLLLEGTPRGIDPEAVARSLADADLIVRSGGDLDEWLDGAIDPALPALPRAAEAVDVALERGNGGGSRRPRLSAFLELQYKTVGRATQAWIEWTLAVIVRFRMQDVTVTDYGKARFGH